MSGDLPDFYFRVRENGAAVFRVDTENRQRRIEMDQIAVVNIRNGEVKPHGDRPLSDQEVDTIRTWMADRRALLARRDMDDIHRAIDQPPWRECHRRLRTLILHQVRHVVLDVEGRILRGDARLTPR